MSEKKDASKASHYLTTHAVGPFAAGQTVTAEQVKKTFGRHEKATPEEHEAYLGEGLKRLLDLGALVPTEAPPDPEEEAAKEAEARKKAAADEEEAAKKHPQHKR